MSTWTEENLESNLVPLSASLSLHSRLGKNFFKKKNFFSTLVHHSEHLMAISIDEANLPEKYYNKAFNPTKNIPHWVSEVELEYFEG